jgi:hypothetical protein
VNDEQKQAYYRYEPGNWFYHAPPELDPKLHKEMEKVGGRDRFGDPLYRFNWGGVAVIRKNEQDDKPTVKGGMSGTLVKRGRLSARYFAGRDRHPRCLVYQNAKREIVRVGREDQVPKGIIAVWEYEYIDYGRLHWFIERKLTPEHMIEAGLFTLANVPPRGDYVCILEIQTPEGLYYEPSESWLELVMKHRYETENEKPSDLLRSDAESRAIVRRLREDDQDLKDNAEVDLYLNQTLGIPIGFLPQISPADVNTITRAFALDRMIGVL